jgi:hypothetical protein
MSDPFENRLREAIVVIDAERTELLRSGVQALAGARETVSTILTLARLAHALPVTPPELDAFLTSAASAGLSIKRGDDQLAGTVAMLTLIDRFAIPLARRTLNRLTPDAAAAEAIVLLAEQQREAVHPDLTIHAADWQARAADYLRAAGRWSGPPELTKPSAPTPSAEGESPTPAPEIGTAELIDHAEKLTSWLRQTSSSAKLAALAEQQDIILWLMSSRPAGSAVQAVQLACTRLQDLAANPIGPPGAQQLLARALGEYADKGISFSELAGTVAQPVPEELRGFCTLLAGQSPDPDVTLTARDAASRLYHELQLVRLVSPLEAA